MTDTERQGLRGAADEAIISIRSHAWGCRERGQYVAEEAWEKRAAAIESLLAERDALSDQVEMLTRERDELIGSVAAHVTVRGEYYARAEALTRENEGLREAIRPFYELAVATTVEGSPDFRTWVADSRDWMVVFSFSGRSITLGQLRAVAALDLADEPAKGEADHV